VLVLDMIEILPTLGKYKYDTWTILPVKSYIDNFVRLQSCIRNTNTGQVLCRFGMRLHAYVSTREGEGHGSGESQ
jgi:hypothetical protein